MIYSAIKFKLYPNQTGLELLAKHGGCKRKIYNHMLERRIKHYKKTGKTISSYDLIKELPALKKKFPWLKEVDSTCLQQAIIDLDKAYKNFFRLIKQGKKPGFPKFKKKSHESDSFRLVMSIQADEEVQMLRLGKLWWMKARGSWDRLEGKIKSITVSQDGGCWYAFVLLKQPDKKSKHKHERDIVAIDLGVVKPICTFDGDKFSTMKSVKFSRDLAIKERKRERYQRQMSRKKLGSNNRKKARYKVISAFKHERDFRNNFLEQTSYDLVTTFKQVIFEDLSIKHMTKKHKKGERPKRKLNHNLLRLGHSALVSKCQRKASKFNTEVILVNPKNTSRCCNVCGSIDELNRKSQADFHCINCGWQDQADHNAARNIMDVGTNKYVLH